MNIAIFQNRTYIYIGIPILLFAFLIGMIQWGVFDNQQYIYHALSIDFLITIPLIYVLLIRNTSIPKTSFLPIMLLGMWIGILFIPKESQNLIHLFKIWMLPIIEGFTFIFLLKKIRASIKEYKKQKNEIPDFFTAVKNSCIEIFPSNVALILATEIAVIYYCFLSWKSRKLKDNEFSYHLNTGTPALLYTFIFVIGIEAFAIHLLLDTWNPSIAWVLTVLSIYTGVQFFSFAKSLSDRPIVLADQVLILRYGFLAEIEIPYSNIISLQVEKDTLPKEKLVKSLSPFGSLEGHTVSIQLKEPQSIQGLYGIQSKCTKIGFTVDNSSEFMERVQQLLREKSCN